MAQSMGELIARFELARQNLAAVLEKDEADTANSILAADRELSTVFALILDAQPGSKEDCAKRIEFLLNEIVVASDDDGLIKTLSEQAMADMKQALSSVVSPQNVVPVAS